VSIPYSFGKQIANLVTSIYILIENRAKIAALFTYYCHTNARTE